MIPLASYECCESITSLLTTLWSVKKIFNMFSHFRRLWVNVQRKFACSKWFASVLVTLKSVFLFIFFFPLIFLLYFNITSFICFISMFSETRGDSLRRNIVLAGELSLEEITKNKTVHGFDYEARLRLVLV